MEDLLRFYRTGVRLAPLEPEVILLAIGWYLRFSRTATFAERGLSVDHVTVWRWVQRYAP
jgi:transposase, IS6 family